MKRRHALWLLGGLVSCGEKVPFSEWRGICFGIPISIKFSGVDHDDAQKLGDEALKIAQSYEAVFSLWDENSELRRLNRDGSLSNPSEALQDILYRASLLYDLTDGFFDPTIHAYLEWVKGEYAEGRIPDSKEADKKRALVNFSRVQFSPKEILLEKGMAMSLNAIAQGYVTDHVARFLEGEDVSALVNFGEYRVVGDKPWTVSVEGNDISLKNSLAVSSGSGERLSATSAANHLIDPKTGKSPPPQEVAAVEALEAWLADGLATVIAIKGFDFLKLEDVTVRVFEKP
ncbi:FAD:protein FMN transferase [Akkermansiaceae bacterium]|nr:FAD:protein FMN transferase [Akkermansiaceae bacterium]